MTDLNRAKQQRHRAARIASKQGSFHDRKLEGDYFLLLCLANLSPIAVSATEEAKAAAGRGL